jgi:hypothetical protein
MPPARPRSNQRPCELLVSRLGVERRAHALSITAAAVSSTQMLCEIAVSRAGHRLAGSAPSA